jgi:phage-related minor tail protein
VPKDIVDEYYERAYEGVEKLKQIHQEHYEISRTWETGWEIAFKKYVENATNASQQAQKVFDTTVRGMEDLFVDFMMKGEANWKEFINSIIEQLLRAELQKLIASVFSGIMGGGDSGGGGGGFMGGILSGIGSAIGGLFGGFFAQGGYLPAGKIGIAGEAGPELITGPANITPMDGMGGNVTYNINAVDARSFQELLARDPAAVHAIVDRGRRQLGMGIA